MTVVELAICSLLLTTVSGFLSSSSAFSTTPPQATVIGILVDMIIEYIKLSDSYTSLIVIYSSNVPAKSATRHSILLPWRL